MELPHSSEGRCLEDYQSRWVDEISLWVFWMFVQLQTKIGIRTKIVIHLVPKKYQASNSSFEIWLPPQPLLNLLTEPPLSLQWCRPLSTASYMLFLVKGKRSLFLAQLCLWHCLLYFECVVEYLYQKRNSKGWSWFSRTFHSAQLFGFDNLTWSCYISYTMKMIQLLNLQSNFF